jgi:hypothetical protein
MTIDLNNTDYFVFSWFDTSLEIIEDYLYSDRFFDSTHNTLEKQK